MKGLERGPPISIRYGGGMRPGSQGSSKKKVVDKKHVHDKLLVEGEKK